MFLGLGVQDEKNVLSEGYCNSKIGFKFPISEKYLL